MRMNDWNDAEQRVERAQELFAQQKWQEAIEELKENEFKDLYADEEKDGDKTYVKDIQIDSDFELLFPDEYINSITERLALYNELSEIKDEKTLIDYEARLIDRLRHPIRLVQPFRQTAGREPELRQAAIRRRNVVVIAIERFG